MSKTLSSLLESTYRRLNAKANSPYDTELLKDISEALELIYEVEQRMDELEDEWSMNDHLINETFPRLFEPTTRYLL